MGFYAGFDTFGYPGDNIMQSLWENTNLYWCGFYLGKRFDWTPHYGKLKEMGWGTAPVYTGKQPVKSPALKAIVSASSDAATRQTALYDNGAADGTEAVQQAKAAGMSSATILYFDVENCVPDKNWYNYYRGWSRAVQDAYFGVGLYTRAAHAAWLQAQLLAEPGFDIILPTVWIAQYTKANQNGATVPAADFLADPFPEPDPTTPWRGASSWQHMGNWGAKWIDKNLPANKQARHFAPVDFNSSIYRDPSYGILSMMGDSVAFA